MQEARGISVKNLYKSFDGRAVLQDLSLLMPCGESVVILGPSGCGKSVFLKCILGLIPHDKGHIRVGPYCIDDKNPLEQNKLFKESGVVFQSSGLLDSYTVLENITFRNPSPENQAAALDLLEKVGLSREIASCMPDEISGGMKRRVALARAVIDKPRYIFFDEPTEGLDPISADIIARLIRQSITDLGATGITISHTLRSAQDIADRVILLDEGRILWQGSPEEMKTSSCSLVQKFIETSQFL